uniref:Uncharacterized protein n=1 Tax=Scleropages formosus TaxID=113540 RepID=A0A8C9RRM7_SCLFO
MSCTKSTIIISSVLGSVANCPKTFSTAQMYPYHASKVFPRAQCIQRIQVLCPSNKYGNLHAEFRKKLLEEKAVGCPWLHVIWSLTDKDNGMMADWEGSSIPW